MTDESSSSSVSAHFRSGSANNEEEDENFESSVEDEDKYHKDQPEQKQSNNLKREVGLFSAILLIVGLMIGSGPSPKSVLQFSGSTWQLSLTSMTVWRCCLNGCLMLLSLAQQYPYLNAEYSSIFMVRKGQIDAHSAFLHSFVDGLSPSKTATVSIIQGLLLLNISFV
ncbi:hypothetical protein AVEN_160660-1 [Araneus ventricosus]|uniref:Uncharacterized protein n=1 Tax=Araneus ventricosus TaxID=182803 RepID=A0A4Y2NQY7_ARAVE|nr:hypothetical protein AVEN_160660-1 [Araneus ventricosus]